MPDIDIDFCYERRQEVIDYVRRKYGADKVVQIVTFGTMAAKGVIRDVARVLDLPYSFGDTLAKMIPNELNITLQKALDMNPELRSRYDTEEQVKNLLDMCMKPGRFTEAYFHACGRCRNLPETGGGICTAFQRIGWFHHNAVHDDNDRRTRTVKDGLFGTADTDGHQRCS